MISVCLQMQFKAQTAKFAPTT